MGMAVVGLADDTIEVVHLRGHPGNSQGVGMSMCYTSTVLKNILGYLRPGYSQHNTPKNGNAKSVVSVDIKTVFVVILPDPSRHTFRPHHADDPRQNDAAWEVFAGPSQGADGRCSTPGAEEPVAATQTRGAHSLEQGPG